MKILLNIDVPDLEQAIGFYTSALGLTLQRKLDDDLAELTGASSSIYLMQRPTDSDAAETMTDKRRYNRHWTPIHPDFVVEDLENATKRALAAGAKQEGECMEWRGSRWITFSDPFGHGFCLIEFSGEGYS